MNELVKLKRRSSRNGKSFSYYLDYVDEDGKRRRISLGHADAKKAESQRKEKEQNLRMGIVMPDSMKLSGFAEKCLDESEIRESTRKEYDSVMNELISVVGNIDFKKVSKVHVERFKNACKKKGNKPATIRKKMRELKIFFNMAVKNEQITSNEVNKVKAPKIEKKKNEYYEAEECYRILKTARDMRRKNSVNWELMILVALTTGMRKSELLNTTWRDVDFESQTIEVCSKEDTDETWHWLVKDNEARTLPLTEEICNLLAKHQQDQPEGYPYVFVPSARYDHIQRRRQEGRWTLSDARLNVLCNFRVRFLTILKRANVRARKFHDLRGTALTNWFRSGLREFEVMGLAGHSDFSTTHKHYLAYDETARDRARVANQENLAHIWRAPHSGDINDLTEKM